MGHTAVTSPPTAEFLPLDTTSVLRPARLLCPGCRRTAGDPPAMEATLVEKSSFHHCRQCGGVWFHDKDLDAALRAAASTTWPTPPEAPPAPGGVVVEKPWACPCCSGTLVEVRDRRGSGVVIRRCLVCYGGWIEHTELLKVLTPADLLSRLGRFVRGMVVS